MYNDIPDIIFYKFLKIEIWEFVYERHNYAFIATLGKYPWLL